MSLVFRFATPDDLPQAARLAAHSFPAVGLSFSEWESALSEPQQGGLGSLWVGEEGGELVGACRLFSYEQWVAGTAIPIMGLGTVAVSPTRRRRGVAADLVGSCLRAARERGDIGSLLYPFRTGFYRKLGYGMAGEAHQYVLPPRSLDGNRGSGQVTVSDSAGERRDVASVYDRWAQVTNGQLVRPPEAWGRVWQKGTRHSALYRSERGDPEGYLVFRYVLDGPSGRAVDVEEAAWLTPSARRGLYGWLASLGDQWDLIVYRAHPSERFADHLTEVRFGPYQTGPRWHFWFSSSTVLMGPMFRILDVPRAWAERSLREPAPLTVALRVHDPYVPENTGPWTLRTGEGGIEAVGGSSGTPDLALEMDIETMSRIYIGSLTLADAVALGRATADRPDHISRIDRMLATASPWTFDRF